MRSKSADMTLKSFAKLVTAGVGKHHSELASLISTGNRKLPKTTAIFNMGPAHGCPSLKLGLCRAFNEKGKHICYAMKAETAYFSEVEPRRIKQKHFWFKTNAEQFASQFLLINAMKESPWNALRFNESGDFWGPKCVAKAERIATILKPYGIRVYVYTHRADLDYTGVRNLVVNGSGFQKEGVKNVFMMIRDVKDRPKGYAVCPMDCRICDRCSIRGNKTVVPMH